MTTASTAPKLCVWYAPLPEERNPNESASRAFADRIFQSTATPTAVRKYDVVVEILDLERIKSAIAGAPRTMTQSSWSSDEQMPTFHFFVVSCDADGSVHKAVRKISRELSKKGVPEATSPATVETHPYCCCAVALLGHARCENSAQQMKDTIFTAGRKFDKALGMNGSFGSTRLGERVEVQVELEGPEESFDPWVKTTLEKLVAQTS